MGQSIIKQSLRRSRVMLALAGCMAAPAAVAGTAASDGLFLEALASVTTGQYSDGDVNLVLDWAEWRHGQLLQPAWSETLQAGGYRYRHYPDTGCYLGEKDGEIWYYDGQVGMQRVGSMAEYLPVAAGAASPRAGELVSTTWRADGETLLEKSWRLYAVDANGQLLADEGGLAAGPVAHVALLEGVSAEPSSLVRGLGQGEVHEPVDVAVMQTWYQDLWNASRRAMPGSSPEKIAAFIGATAQSLEEIHGEMNQSGMSADEWVAFYTAVGQLWPEDGREEGYAELEAFLDAAGLTAGDFIALLGEIDPDWAGLLGSLAGADFLDLYDAWMHSGKELSLFLRERLTGVRQRKVDPVEAGRLGLDIAKFAWEVIKDNSPTAKAEGAYTSILSPKDKSYVNYEKAIRGRSAKYTVDGKFLFFRLFFAELTMSGYYGATHPHLGGKWMPSIGFDTGNIYAAITWNLNVNATITAAANVGTAEAPVPEVQVVAKVQARNFAQNMGDSFSFIANGANGFSLVEK